MLRLNQASEPVVPDLYSSLFVASMRIGFHVEPRICVYSSSGCWLSCHSERGGPLVWQRHLLIQLSAGWPVDSNDCDAISTLRMQHRPAFSGLVACRSCCSPVSCNQRCSLLEPKGLGPCQELAVSKLRCNQHSARRKARGLHGPWIPW